MDFDPLAVPDDARPRRLRPAPTRTAPIYGEVYELITSRPDLDTDHPYVGLGRGHNGAFQRVYSGRGAHTRRESVAKDSWKARILPVGGPAGDGFRVLERVEATGDDAEDERTLRNAEAYWIRKLKTKYNRQRPAYDPSGAPVSRTGAAPRPARPAESPKARAERIRTRVFTGTWAALSLVVLVWLTAVRQVPGMAPWVISPVAALLLWAPVFFWVDGMVQRVKTPRRAPARRRRRR